MKYKKIDTKLFVKNRKNFVNKLEQKSIAFFNSNDIYPISADSTLPFDQHRDIFYLSGIDQEESILVLFPDSKNMIFKILENPVLYGIRLDRLKSAVLLS